MTMPPKSIPPSIPVRKPPPNSYTGKRGDIPGPANYNPNHEITKIKQRVIDFSRRPENTKSSMFISKVPNCKGTKDDNGIPGPGSYFTKKKKYLHTRSHSDRIGPNGRGFLTSTKREGFWDNTLEAPFTKGTNKEVGNWPRKCHKKIKSQGGNRNKNSNAIQQAFHSSEIRDCLKGNRKIQSPGPGQYIDLNFENSIGNQPIIMPQTDQRVKHKSSQAKNNHFKTKTTRFTGGFFQAKEGPGPGDYEQEVQSMDNEDRGILTKAQRRNKGKFGSVFKSTTERFIKNDKKNPWVRILDQKEGSQYNDLMVYNLKGGFPQSQPQGMLHKTRKVGFTATSTRFMHNQVFYGEKLKYTPGPGDYHSSGRRPKTFSHNRGVGRKQGFGSYVSSKGTNFSVGPGSYLSTDCTMIKKSYNMRI